MKKPSAVGSESSVGAGNVAPPGSVVGQADATARSGTPHSFLEEFDTLLVYGWSSMSRSVAVAVIQRAFGEDRHENRDGTVAAVAEALAGGADVVLPPELFEG